MQLIVHVLRILVYNDSMWIVICLIFFWFKWLDLVNATFVSQVFVAVLGLTLIVQWDQRRLSHDLKPTALVLCFASYNTLVVPYNNDILYGIRVPGVDNYPVFVNR